MKQSNTENLINSIRLFDLITADKNNAMFSPVSLNMALGLIEAGAEGKTKMKIDSYLQTKNYADLAEEYLKFIKEKRTQEESKSPYSLFFGDDPASVLEIANSFWADNAFPIKDDYKRYVSSKFDAEIKNLDFADKENIIKEINSWVNEKTHKMISSVISDYDPKTSVVLVNTVYFESNWLSKWDIDDKNKESFTLSDNTVKEIPFMYKEYKFGCYFENDHAVAFNCEYRNGLTFIGILPKEHGEFTLDGLDIPALLESGSYKYDVSAVMPRLKFDSDFKLRDALCAVGLECAFDERMAEFSGISDTPLCITEILQKTSLDLDEKGTKAAAATDAVIAYGVPIPHERKIVRLDRPFAFMIYDKDEQQTVFVGKVTDP